MGEKQTQGEIYDLVAILIPQNADADTRYRLNKFARWMAEEGRTWHRPDLAVYRDYLLAGGGKANRPLEPVTVRAHLSTVRVRYQELLDKGGWINPIRPDAPGQAPFLENDIAGVIRDGIDAKKSTVGIPPVKADKSPRRLTVRQALALVESPGTDTFAGLRDTALLAMLAGLGLGERELSALNVEDLNAGENGLSLRIRLKNGAQRFVPYGNLAPVLRITERWLKAAGIESGAVFRSFWRGGNRLRGRLRVRAIQYVVAGYPQFIDGQLTPLTAGDLRRSSKYLSGDKDFTARMALLSGQAGQESNSGRPGMDLPIEPEETRPTVPRAKTPGGDWRVW